MFRPGPKLGVPLGNRRAPLRERRFVVHHLNYAPKRVQKLGFLTRHVPWHGARRLRKPRNKRRVKIADKRLRMGPQQREALPQSP